MKQLIYIGGGEVFRNDNDFAEALKTRKYEPFKEPKKRSSRLLNNLKEKFEIEHPAMPNRFNARYKLRKIRFEKILPHLNNENLILIGYSMGGIFLAKYLSENIFPKKIHQLHLVAPVFGEIDLPPHDDYLADFVFDAGGLKNLESQVEKTFLYGSHNDPLVPFSHIQKYQEYLPKAQVFVFEDRGHFQQSEFPELLENILI